MDSIYRNKQKRSSGFYRSARIFRKSNFSRNAIKLTKNLLQNLHD